MEKQKQVLVSIAMGSDSDWANFEKGANDLIDVLDACSIRWERNTISAHRNQEMIEPYVRGSLGRGTRVFITAASMAAHLSGAIAAWAKNDAVVIGVPLPSKERPDASDALMAMIQMPPGVPVAVPGIGESGLQKAGILAAQILSTQVVDPEIIGKLRVYLEEKKAKKPARIAFETSYSRQKGV